MSFIKTNYLIVFLLGLALTTQAQPKTAFKTWADTPPWAGTVGIVMVPPLLKQK